MDVTRRAVLKSSVSTVATAGFSGCLGSPEGDRDGSLEGYTAFFTLWDWAEQVGGEHFSFVNPVDTGQMGHGWSPDGDITRNVASSDAFIYLDSPEFAWAQDIAAELQRDYEDITVIDLLGGIESRLQQSESGHDEEHGGEEFHDPHVWIDPILASEMIESIVDGLVETDPDHEDDYREHAANYIERIEAVHEAFDTLVDDAERGVAVLAGHDSFGYLERRYGFDLHTPVGVSPDAAESFEDISGVIETIEEHDIETVLYDPFEAPDPPDDLPQMVEVIFEHTDVDSAEPLSSVSGTTAEWEDRGWGWVEQMEELNLPSLRAALGVEESR
ncbi:MAG: zinc ABC transporter substrate-binding protein [Natronomonas sp.]